MGANNNKRWARELAKVHGNAFGRGGICDWCSKPIRKGSGYLINQAILMVPYSADSPELICKECFEKKKPKAWDAAGRAHTILEAKKELCCFAEKIKKREKGYEKKLWRFWKR